MLGEGMTKITFLDFLQFEIVLTYKEIEVKCQLILIIVTVEV